jgi:hypothetical protein
MSETQLQHLHFVLTAMAAISMGKSAKCFFCNISSVGSQSSIPICAVLDDTVR